MDDFYATLGVSPNAPLAEIKDRYRFLAHAYHPDKFSTDAHKRDAGEAFKKINEAFQTLSNPSLRADYDKWRTSGSANEPKSSPPPPRPASERPPPQTPPSPRTKRPGTIKYLMAAIFWSITGGMLGALAGPLGALAGVVVGLWFGIWVCNREPKPHAAPPPQQKPQPAPPSGREWSLAVFIAFLVVIVGAAQV